MARSNKSLKMGYITLTHKVRMYPTEKQKELLNLILFLEKYVWNWNIENMQKNHTLELVGTREIFEERCPELLPLYCSIPKSVLCQTIKDLENCKKAWLDSKSGKRRDKVGFPKKCKARYSISFLWDKRQPDQRFHTVEGTNDTVHIISKIGNVKVDLHKLHIDGHVREFILKKDRTLNDTWWLEIVTVCKKPKRHQIELADGGDYNVRQDKTLVTTHEEITPLERAIKTKNEIAVLQKNNSCKIDAWKKQKNKTGNTKKSKRLLKYENLLNKKYLHLTNEKLDHWHKVSDIIASTTKIFGVENLKFSSFKKRRNNGAKGSNKNGLGFGKAIQFQNIGLLFNMLNYKCDALVKIKAANTSKIHNECLAYNPQMVLGVNEGVCVCCGEHFDRDKNAAKNICDLAIAQLYNEDSEKLQKLAKELNISNSELIKRIDRALEVKAACNKKYNEDGTPVITKETKRKVTLNKKVKTKGKVVVLDANATFEFIRNNYWKKRLDANEILENDKTIFKNTPGETLEDKQHNYAAVLLKEKTKGEKLILDEEQLIKSLSWWKENFGNKEKEAPTNLKAKDDIKRLAIIALNLS